MASRAITSEPQTASSLIARHLRRKWGDLFWLISNSVAVRVAAWLVQNTIPTLSAALTELFSQA